MNANDRKLLERAGLAAKDIAKTEEVLQVWEVQTLLVPCGVCGKVCINPEVRLRKFRRKKPPSDLFQKFTLGLADRDGGVICEPCDDERFQ